MSVDLLTSRQLAAELGVREETVRRYARLGWLQPAEITVSGQYRFNLDASMLQLQERRYVRPGRARS